MSLNLSVGIGSALDGKQAVTHAIHYAFNRIQQRDIALALIISSQDFDVQEVLSSAASLLGNIPLFGFSTSKISSEEGDLLKAVAVVLFSSKEISAKTNWWSGFGDNTNKVADRMLSSLASPSDSVKALLLAADGVLGDSEKLAEKLSDLSITTTGWLAGGRALSKETWQMGGGKGGSNGLASAELSGIKIGVGFAHGWDKTGAVLRITMSRGPWIRSMDGTPVSEMYARLFGHQALDWTNTPLNALVRLYPFSIRGADPGTSIIRAPLWVEPDGSVRMNTHVPDGSTADLMIGSLAGCLEALDEVVEQALSQMGETKAVFGLLIADQGWEMLLKGQSVNLAAEITDRLGGDVPVLGAYTYGQIGRLKSEDEVKYLNQHIQLILFGVD